MTKKNDELLFKKKGKLDPNREHFESHQEYYSDNVKSGLDNWFYFQVMNYLSKHTPIDLLRTDWIENKKHIYKLYVDKCKELDCLITDEEDFDHEIQEMLEAWLDVFRGTEYDPDLN